MRVANVSGEDVPLAGYSIRGAGGDPLGLPAVVLPPGRTVLVRCGNESDRLAGGREQVQVGWPGGERVIVTGARIDVVNPEGAIVDGTTAR
jgi:hypothetical protein